MLLRDDVVAHRQAETGALPGRLGSEEWLKQPILDFGRNTDAVVTHPDFDRTIQVTCADLKRGFEARHPLCPLPFARRVESIAEWVEQHASHVLRCQCDGRNALTKLAMQGHFEALVLRARRDGQG